MSFNRPSILKEFTPADISFSIFSEPLKSLSESRYLSFNKTLPSFSFRLYFFLQGCAHSPLFALLPPFAYEKKHCPEYDISLET